MNQSDQIKEIYLKTIKVIKTHLNNNGGVVCEIGDTDTNYKYVFVDIGLGLGKRKSIDNAKVVFMNECMQILLELNSILNIETPIETVDEYINCSSFICGPDCSCREFVDESYNYQKIDQMFLDGDDIQ
tara:strand:- start:130 stop:516 length:387 start_codon:yes stop_codon:yes gene_type:complete